MNLAIIDDRRRARRWRNYVLENCRVVFPGQEIDFPDLHDPEFATDILKNDPHKLDTIVCRSINGDRLH